MNISIGLLIFIGLMAGLYSKYVKKSFYETYFYMVVGVVLASMVKYVIVGV